MAQTRRSPARAATAAKDRKMLLRAAQLEKCRMSLWEFQKQRDPKFFRDSRPHLKKISDVLQGVFERKLLKPDGTPYRKVVLSIPPRHGKSYSIAGFGQWAYGKRHDTRIGVVSYNDILTGRFSQGVRDQIAEEKATPEQIVYSDIFPEVKLRYGDSARGIWALEGEYFSFLATSFGGTMTGIGFNIGIIDDPIKLPEEAHNDAILDNQFAWYTDAFLSRLEEDAMVVIVMTRWATGLDFIPAFVVINGGLSGDLLGESDVLELQGNQKAYDDTKSDDIDALKYQMFGQKLFIDASPESIENVRIAPNAMIDIQTEPGSAQQAKAQVLEAGFAYGDHLAQALDRLKDDMHEIISVPRLTPDLLSGLGTSGKALRMLYWNLNCRCEEKWAGGWDGAIRWMVEHALRMARIYGEELPEIDYTLTIDHLYPVIDDDEEERERDLSEVHAQARSRRSYIAKWQPDDDPDGELRQILREKRLLEDAFEGAIRSESLQRGV